MTIIYPEGMRKGSKLTTRKTDFLERLQTILEKTAIIAQQSPSTNRSAKSDQYEMIRFLWGWITNAVSAYDLLTRVIWCAAIRICGAEIETYRTERQITRCAYAVCSAIVVRWPTPLGTITADHSR